MHLGKLVLAAGTFVAAALFSQFAQAEVVTASALNVRADPGGRVIGVLHRGDEVRVVDRAGGWCQISLPGRNGWVSCSYLARGGGDGGTIIIDRDRDRGDADVNLSFSIPGFSFSIGSGGFDFDRPRRPDRRDRVCFYEHVNYDGDRFCARPGERLRSLGSWNDRISSIRVFGDAEAQVCEHNAFRGRCVIIDRNVRNLGRRGNDIISSIRVR